MVNLYKRSREMEKEREKALNDFTFGEGIAMSFGEKFYRDIYERV